MSERLPLRDVLVVSLEQAVVGPLCSRVLADFGARVIKVERSGGDQTRNSDRVCGAWSSVDLWANAGKESLVLDVKHPRGFAVLLRLIERADILIENLRPGVVEELGLTWGLLSERNPCLVFCQVSGYGQDGPYADRPAYDAVLQAEAGLMALTGTAEAPAKVGTPIIDGVTGIYAAMAVVMALLEARQTGVGRRVDVSMLEGGAWLLGQNPFRYWYLGEVPQRTGARHAYYSPNGVYGTSDGEIMISAPSDGLFARFCDVIGRPDLCHDPLFVTSTARGKNRRQLDAIIEPILRERLSDDWMELLEAAKIPCGLVRSIGEVWNHPQLQYRRFLSELDTPQGVLKVFNFPAKFDGDYRSPKSPPPLLGEHSDAILTELGYGDDEIDILRREGVV